ncbi:hypothetical protein [Neobacillus drentensis]|uniref:hypothetical protein n=1 Tax=Neobacillus drentensis TaxID=220684 RepID=UPI002FFE60A6
MKKIMVTMLTSLSLLTGCQSHNMKASEPKTPQPHEEKTILSKSDLAFPYPNLLAQNNQTYSLLVVGANDEQSPIEKNQKVTEHVKNILSLPTLEIVQQAYPELEIRKTVSYILFNQSGMVHQSTNITELTKFLQENPPTN